MSQVWFSGNDQSVGVECLTRSDAFVINGVRVSLVTSGDVCSRSVRVTGTVEENNRQRWVRL